MADIYAVKFNNSGGVNIPIVTLETTYTLKIRFQTGTALATDALVATAAETGGAPTNFVAVYANGDIRVRKAGTVVYQSALSLFAANKRYELTMTVTSSTASLTVLNITDSTTIINAASFAMTGQFTFDRIGTGGASTALAFNGLIGEVEITNSTANRKYISTVNTGSTWTDAVSAQNGTLTGLPTDGTQWEFYETVAGTAPTGTVTIGSITPNSTGASVPFTYSAADQTGFEYRINGGTVVTGTNSPQVVSGLTPSTAYSIEIRAINASGAGAWSAPANFTTSAAGSPPAGTFTIGTITTTQTTASVPYTYSAADFDSIEYRIDGGTPVTASSSPQSLSGLTSATTYGIEFRAVNAFGNGAWSTSAPFTTAVATATFTTGVLRRLVGGAPLVNTALTYFRLYNPTTGALVLNRTDLSTDANGRVTCTDAALTAGVEYKADWLAATGETRMSKKAAT